MQDLTITFIGAGNMARSLLSGLLAAGAAPQRLRAGDPDAGQRRAIGELGVVTFDDNDDAVADADVVVLAVKPQVLGRVLEPLTLDKGQLVVSIAAGVPLDALERWTPAGTPIVRCMPNTPALLGAGITGMFANAAVSEAQRDAADTVLRSAGRTLWVPEEDALDAVTGVSGSGPAYFFYLMEAMIDAGVDLGLTREAATTLTLETAYGAARMAREGTESPAQLRANVTSPGGTTERAVSILEAARFRDAVGQAVAGAAQRARELAEDIARS